MAGSRLNGDRAANFGNIATVGSRQTFHGRGFTNPQIRLVLSDYFLLWPASGTVRHTLRLPAKRTRSREDFHGCANLCPEPGDTVGCLWYMAQPHAHHYSHGGDCRSLLGGFPLSGPAEEVPRRDPGQSCWSAHLWHCVSRRPLDAVFQAGLADEHQLARCQPRRHDVLIPVRPGRAGVSRYAEAAADEISLSEYPDRG